MMRALYQIGKLVKSGSNDPLADIVDRVAPGTHVIALELQTDEDGTVSLVNPEAPFRLLFEASEGDCTKIGYKRKGSQGPNFTPVAMNTFPTKNDTREMKISTLDGKIFSFYKSYIYDVPEIIAIKELLANTELQDSLRRYFWDFMTDLFAGKPINDRPKSLLTVTVDGKLPGECEEYRELLNQSATGILGAGKSEGQGVCSLTFEENKRIYGNPSKIFPFYTLDKPGMITGGFQEKNAWKNFPVSANGGQALKQARDYLDKRQNFYMPGNFSYWVIPKFVFNADPFELQDILDSLASYSDSSPGFGLGQEARDRFSEIDERVRFIAKLAESQVLLSFLFWERKSSQLKINLLVDDVPPTRLRRLIKAQHTIAQLKTYSTWQNATSDTSETDRTIRFSFGLVWPFYKREAQKSRKLNYGEDYLRFIRELYLGYAPDPHLILRLIMEYLEALHKDPEDNSFLYKPLYALCWLRFLCELGLWQPALNYKGEIMKLNELSIEPVFKKRDENGRFSDPWMAYIEDFYQEHQTMLANPFLFGTFLLGCLVRMMMNIQAHKLSSTPFEKELKGLRLKKSDIPILFSKTMAKLRDYEQGDTYKVLDELISDLCLRGNRNEEQVSDEEVSAWLAFGLAQGRVFKKLVDLEKEKNNTNTSNRGEGE